MRVFTIWPVETHQRLINKGDDWGFLGKRLSDTSDTSDIRDWPKVLKCKNE
jgi:hypothetical protein